MFQKKYISDTNDGCEDFKQEPSKGNKNGADLGDQLGDAPFHLPLEHVDKEVRQNSGDNQ
jgi:hypothetical protein